jgi:CO/xanthine dehydrogenase FAD-binding subunit
LLALNKDRIADARVVLTGVGDKPWRDRELEAGLVGEKASAELFNKIASDAAARIDPGSDIHASASYRRSLARVLTRRALAEAWRRAQNGN